MLPIIPILYMLFGACLIVAWKHVQNLKQTKKKESFDEFPTFFLNVLLLNKKEVIKNEVNKKVRKGMFGIGRRIAGSVASRVVSDQKFTQKIAEKIVIGIPPKFKFNDSIFKLSTHILTGFISLWK